MSYYTVDWSDRFPFGSPRRLSSLIGVAIHTTENGDQTRAEDVAQWQINTRTGSYHVIVDSFATRLRCNTDDWSTWSTGNKGNDVLLHCAAVARASWSRSTWLAHDVLLNGIAIVVAHWLKNYGWPVEYDADVDTLPGITDHDATREWGGTDHTDPGPNFPWDVLLDKVARVLSPTPEKETAMTPEERSLLIEIRDLARVIRDQLTGPGSAAPGWPQGGNRTLYDLTAAIAEVEGVTGTRDTKQ